LFKKNDFYYSKRKIDFDFSLNL